MRKILLAFFLMVPLTGLLAQYDRLRISLFHELELESFVLSVEEGSYLLYYGDSLLGQMESKDLVYLSALPEKLGVRQRDGGLSGVDSLDMVALNDSCVIRFKGMFPQTPVRSYTGDILVRRELGRMRVINELSVERYLAGVVQAEGGPFAPYTFFKVQAIIARTYAYTHMGKHQGEGFHLCDGVHCQVYHGREINPDILKAVLETKSLVITDHDSLLINATFHSNCGGETANSSDVWIGGKPYLISVKDPWCSGGRNYRWSREIPEADWLDYFRQKGLKAADEAVAAHEAPHRWAEISVGNQKLSSRELREDWGLRSAFVSWRTENGTVVLSGNGYGHGVGLCQEGAMEMADQGKTVDEIIQFYYHNVLILPLEKGRISSF